jgi:acyl carrier protein
VVSLRLSIHELEAGALYGRPCVREVDFPPRCDNVRIRFMSDPDLRTRIKEMLVKNLMLQITPDQIGDDLPLFGPDGLGLDSIDALELAVSMEKIFGVSVPNSEVAGKALRTVNTIHDYILEKRGNLGQT